VSHKSPSNNKSFREEELKRYSLKIAAFTGK
jgi:hypothetical protein